jgi:hypothetical protein
MVLMVSGRGAAVKGESQGVDLNIVDAGPGVVGADARWTDGEAGAPVVGDQSPDLSGAELPGAAVKIAVLPPLASVLV